MMVENMNSLVVTRFVFVKCCPVRQVTLMIVSVPFAYPCNGGVWVNLVIRGSG